MHVNIRSYVVCHLTWHPVAGVLALFSTDTLRLSNQSLARPNEKSTARPFNDNKVERYAINLALVFKYSWAVRD